MSSTATPTTNGGGTGNAHHRWPLARVVRHVLAVPVNHGFDVRAVSVTAADGGIVNVETITSADVAILMRELDVPADQQKVSVLEYPDLGIVISEAEVDGFHGWKLAIRHVHRTPTIETQNETQEEQLPTS